MSRGQPTKVLKRHYKFKTIGMVQQKYNITPISKIKWLISKIKTKLKNIQQIKQKSERLRCSGRVSSMMPMSYAVSFRHHSQYKDKAVVRRQLKILHCHLRNGCFVTVNQVVMTTINIPMRLILFPPANLGRTSFLPAATLLKNPI